MEIKALGDTAFLIRDENRIHPEVNQRIRGVYQMLKCLDVSGLVDLVPAYADLMIQYNPDIISYKEIYAHIKHALDQPLSADTSTGKLHRVPVVYGGDYGPDLAHLMKVTGYSRKQVIRLHTQSLYLIYMIGFTPGFPYLGGMDERIACARKKTPALNIPAGSVGIADKQTGIYPSESPGGWQIIGRTPLTLFNSASDAPFLLKQGERIEFYEIFSDQFNESSDA